MSMPTAKKKKLSWSEKLDRDEGFPKVVPIGPSMTSQWGEGTMVIPSPREVDEIMRRIPEGKLITINEIRAVLARRHGATMGCPMTTGIFAWIAANAAEEDVTIRGDEDATPYWRTLKTGGFLNDKYPGGVSAQKARLEEEGHRVVQQGKRFTVVGYENALAVDEADD
jgi:6-O-methylguanine DNA methyltransferase, DNA binding domain